MTALSGCSQALTEARLVTVSDGEIEVSHEALLQEWPRYRDWLEDDRVGRRLHAHLTTTAQEWDARGRDPGDLYRGARLAGAQTWAAQHGDLMTARRARLSDRQRPGGAARGAPTARSEPSPAPPGGRGGIVVCPRVAAGVFAEIQRGSADQRRRTAQSLQLATSAQATLATDPELSALLALHGLRVSATDQAAQALRDALSQLRVRATLHTSAGVTGASVQPRWQRGRDRERRRHRANLERRHSQAGRRAHCTGRGLNGQSGVQRLTVASSSPPSLTGPRGFGASAAIDHFRPSGHGLECRCRCGVQSRRQRNRDHQH